MSAKPLRSEMIYRELQRDIITCRLQPGERLTELELAGRFQTSQAPVRECLQRLQEQGYVRIVKHTGSFVSPISLEEMRDLFQLRGMIECKAVVQALSLLRNEQVQQLRRILVRMSAHAEQGELYELIESDMEFHRSLIEFSGRKTLLQIWNLIDWQIRRFLMLYHPRQFDKLQDIAATHQVLLQAIVHGDTANAEHAFEQHLKVNWQHPALLGIAEGIARGGMESVMGRTVGGTPTDPQS